MLPRSDPDDRVPVTSGGAGDLRSGANGGAGVQVQWVTGVGLDRHLSVSVNAPSGLLLSTVDDSRGQISFQAQETGVQ